MKVIDVKGSFEVIGNAVGEAMRNEVAAVCEAIAEQVQRIPLVDGIQLDAYYEHKLAAAHPDAVAYLRGLAAGAQVRYDAVVRAAHVEELLAWNGGSRAEKCSTIAWPGPRGWVVGHNEDFARYHLGRMFVLDMRPNGLPRTVSCNYAVQLPCLAGVLNENGFCITNNSMPGPSRLKPAVAACIMKAAQARTRGEALGVLTTGAYSLPTHFTLLGSDGGASSIEIADESYADAGCSIQGLREAYAHTNHPLRLVFSGDHQPSASSIDRLRYLNANLDNFASIGGVCQYPENVGKDDSVTLVTVFIRPATMEFLAYEPRDTNRIRITL